jgi:hypothetical protein
MTQKRTLIIHLRIVKSQRGWWSLGQQQLFAALEGKRGMQAVWCCPNCLEEARGDDPLHSCGQKVELIQIKEPKAILGGYYSAW